MVAGKEATESDKVSIAVEDGVIENVEEFSCLESVIAASGTVDADVKTRLLRHPVLLVPFTSQCS